jgi:hypothetical protein
MLHPSPDIRKKSSGKSHTDSMKHHDTMEKTTSNGGYVSHRQAWSERKKKKLGDKVRA